MKKNYVLLIICFLGASGCSTFNEALNQPPKTPQYGYIDNTGKFVIEPQFTVARHFAEDLARVKIEGKWGYINQRGDVVIKPQFEEAGYFSEGLARVKLNAHWGYIDKEGTMVIETKFDDAVEFSDLSILIKHIEHSFLLPFLT